MRKWLAAIVSLFVFAVVLMPLAMAQEDDDDFVPPSPTEIVTLQLIKPPPVHRFVQAKYPSHEGPNLDEGDGDDVFNDPADPFQVESPVRMTTTTYAVANPTGTTLGGGGAMMSAGRSGASASSASQDARRSIKKLIKQLN